MPAGMEMIQMRQILGYEVTLQQLKRLENLGLTTYDQLTDRYLLKDNFVQDLILRELR